MDNGGKTRQSFFEGQQVQTMKSSVSSGFTESTDCEDARRAGGWGGWGVCVCRQLAGTWVGELNRETPHTLNLLGTPRPLLCGKGSQKVLDQLTRMKAKFKTMSLLCSCTGVSSPPSLLFLCSLLYS